MPVVEKKKKEIKYNYREISKNQFIKLLSKKEYVNEIIKASQINKYSSVEDYIQAIADKIEISIYSYTIKKATKLRIAPYFENDVFRRIYIFKTRSLSDNLDETSYLHNKNFKTNILSGDLDVNNIAFIQRCDVHRDNWKTIIEKKKAEDEYQSIRNKVNETDEYKCSRCKKNKTTYYQMQTRSADEPMTTFVTCIHCNHRWKF